MRLRAMDAGFSLVELIISLAVVAIIAAIALPSYEAQIRKGRRSDGTTLLMEAYQLQERFYTENNTYAVSMGALGYPSVAGTWIKSPERHYRVRVQTTGACALPSCYRLLAQTFSDSQAEDGHLRLWSDGRKQRKIDGIWQEGWD